jgi:SAM-dependent methyltransferase
MLRARFDQVVKEYEQGRPSYPDGVFDAIEAVAGPLADQRVIEGGAGTGIASRQLAERGARVLAFDVSRPMLERARGPDARPLVLADGNALPFRSGTADLVCFASAWHWLDSGQGSAEAARVLRSGGTWAAWWSSTRADGEPWFEDIRSLLDRAGAAYDWSFRDRDWGATLGARDIFADPTVITVRWARATTATDLLTGLRSQPAVAALRTAVQHALLADVNARLHTAFGDEPFVVPHDTRVWTAQRR